jgi:hypothetical protein
MSRRAVGLAVLALLAVVVAAVGLDRSASRGNDFDNFHDAAVSVWRDGALLLEKSTLRYPPTFQVFLSPLGAFSLPAASFVWLVLNAAALACLPWALARLSGTPPARQGWAWYLVAPFVASNVTLGQSGPLLLALATLGVLAAAAGRPVAGGFALAWAGLLKVFPGALVAVPFVLGRARDTLLGVLLALGVAALWVSLAIGPRAGLDDCRRWVGEIRHEQGPHQLLEAGRSLRYNNQGLAITIVRSLSVDWNPRPELAARGSRQVLALPGPAAWGVYYATVAALAAALVACGLRARHRRGPRTFLGLQALAVPAMLALSPIVWTHYFLWWLPAGVYLADRKRLLAALGTVSLLGLFSVPARALGLHMAISLLLFALVAHRLWHETEPALESQLDRKAPPGAAQ